MVKAGFSESPDGAITSFTLDTTPATGGLVWIIHNGQILKVVASGPGVGECTVSGTAVEVGLAPTAADSFWAYVQDNIQNTIRRTEITGAIDGANKSYTIASIPAGTNVLVVFNGLVCEQDATPEANEFSFTAGSSGTDTVLLWQAPFLSDELYVYAPTPANSATATFATTTSADDVETTFTLTKTGQLVGDVPDYFVTLNGQMQYRRSTIGASTDYTVNDKGDAVTHAEPIVTADAVVYYALAARELDWDILIARTQRLIDDEDGWFHTEAQVRKFLEHAELFVTVFRALGEETGDLSLTSGTATYKIHDTFADFIAPLRVTISNVALRESHISQLQALDSQWYSTTGAPQFYYMIGGKLLGFYPVPNGSLTATITRLKVPDGSVDKYAYPSVDPVWQNILPLYAAALALISEGKISDRVQGMMQQFMDAVGLKRDRRFMPGAAQKEVAKNKTANPRRSAED
jgi:hypothetical protein